MMLKDVVETITVTGHTPTVLATEPIELDVDCITSTESLSSAVNSLLQPVGTPESRTVYQDTVQPKSVVMADLGIVTEDALDRLFSTKSDVTISPGFRGGTNALVVRSSDFYVDYHDCSYLDHRAIAREQGLDVSNVDSFRLACDIDRPADLVELLLHGTGQAAEYVSERFEFAPEDHSLPIRRST
jgi:2-phospho-L-lactate guanylyltransferase